MDETRIKVCVTIIVEVHSRQLWLLLALVSITKQAITLLPLYSEINRLDNAIKGPNNNSGQITTGYKSAAPRSVERREGGSSLPSPVCLTHPIVNPSTIRSHRRGSGHFAFYSPQHPQTEKKQFMALFLG